MVYAGFWRRFVALILIDGIILNIAFFILLSPIMEALFPTAAISPHDPSSAGLGKPEIIEMIVQTLCAAAYDIFFISSNWQATPGKRVMGIKVVTVDGKRLSRPRALGRYVASFLTLIATFGISHMLAGWTKEKTALHDLIADTRVVFEDSIPPVTTV